MIVVEGDQKAPFSIATTLRCRGGLLSHIDTQTKTLTYAIVKPENYICSITDIENILFIDIANQILMFLYIYIYIYIYTFLFYYIEHCHDFPAELHVHIHAQFWHCHETNYSNLTTWNKCFIAAFMHIDWKVMNITKTYMVKLHIHLLFFVMWGKTNKVWW